MNLKGLVVIVIVAVAIVLTFKTFWHEEMKTSRSGQNDSAAVRNGDEGSASAEVYDGGVADAPMHAKFVQIKPVVENNFQHYSFTVETLGYREIRIFAQLFADEYKIHPMPKHAVMTVVLMHELKGLGVPYGEHSFKQEVTSYLEGWVTEQVFGKKLKIGVSANNLPRGRYTLQLSYYLLP